MFFNDRRKAKKAASATMKTTLGQMAKSGSLRATTTTPSTREFGKVERAAVREEVAKSPDWGSRADRWSKATERVDKAKDVKGYDGPGYRKMDADNNKYGQQKKYLPKKGKK